MITVLPVVCVWILQVPVVYEHILCLTDKGFVQFNDIRLTTPLSPPKHHVRNLLQDPDQNLDYALGQNRYRDRNLVENPFQDPLKEAPMTVSTSYNVKLFMIYMHIDTTKVWKWKQKQGR
jgi:hypothetical protein